jgi:superfamily I DNA and RNA helicase
MAQKLVNIQLFNFQDLKLNTKDIIVVLKDTLNTTSSLIHMLQGPIRHPGETFN